MISVSLLSLPPDTLRRMVSHQATSETSCRRWERVGGLIVVAIFSGASVAAALLFVP
jgi:hypothetical protein